MKDFKKDDYWATSVKRYKTDGESNFKEQGYIYLNLRDLKTEGNMESLLQAMHHELNHLVSEKKRDLIMDELKLKLRR
jgi:predicted SprT family Zn-dependent metalloprotease